MWVPRSQQYLPQIQKTVPNDKEACLNKPGKVKIKQWNAKRYVWSCTLTIWRVPLPLHPHTQLAPTIGAVCLQHHERGNHRTAPRRAWPTSNNFAGGSTKLVYCVRCTLVPIFCGETRGFGSPITSSCLRKQNKMRFCDKLTNKISRSTPSLGVMCAANRRPECSRNFAISACVCSIHSWWCCGRGDSVHR